MSNLPLEIYGSDFCSFEIVADSGMGEMADWAGQSHFAQFIVSHQRSASKFLDQCDPMDSLLRREGSDVTIRVDQS